MGGSKDDLSDVRIGVFPDWFNDCTPGVKQHTSRALDALKARGAKVVQIAIPNLGEARLAHAIKIASEFASEWDGVLGHSKSSLVEPNTRVVASLGSSMTALEIISAEKVRCAMRCMVRCIVRCIVR
jgi:Asp-tRNA(Asn)/Glu-tRNA(Gln) amidotransferase A subunit family amidase